MLLNIKNVILHNFLSFEDAELDLKNNGYVLVNGVNENPNDNAKSNGSGKSSLLESIAWCLTGETIRGCKDVERIGSDDECRVELNFDYDGHTYKLIRTKNPSNLFMYVDGEDCSGKGIRDTQQILEHTLPDITSQLIGSVIILGQGMPQRFTNNTPSGRKKVLETLSKSDFMINDLKSRVENRQKELNDSITENNDKINKLRGANDVNKKQVDELKQKLDTMSDKELNDKLSMLKTELDKNNVWVEETENHVNEVKGIIERYNNQLTDLTNKHYEKLMGIPSSNPEIPMYESLLSKASTTMNLIARDIEQMESITDVCPTCGQKIPGKIKPDTSAKKEEYKEIEKQFNDYASKLAPLKKKMGDEINEENAKFDEEKRILNEQIVAQNTCLETATKAYKGGLDTKNKLEVELAVVENKLENFNKDIEDINIKIKELSTEIQASDADIVKLEESKTNIGSRLEIVNKMMTALKRDFRGYLLVNIVDYINEKANEYSKIVFGISNMEFKIDGNDILIKCNGKEYETLSGGEKQKVDLIVQLSLRDMLCTYLDFSCNIICFDELFDNLDSVGCNNVIDLLTTELQDVNSTYIITHHQDLNIPFDREIIVTKGADNVSRLN